MKQKANGVILTASKADTTICEVFGDLPSGLIPVNGKPIIFYILQQFLDNNINDIYIGVDYDKEKLKSIVDLYFKDKLNLNYIYTDKSCEPGNSLLKILKNVKSDNAIINLGDTYIKNLKPSDLSNKIVVSKDFLNEEKWAIVEVDNANVIQNYLDKQKVTSKNIFALTGVYGLNNISVFDQYKEKTNKIQITDLLEFYHQHSQKLQIHTTNDWLDFGHIDRYYISKKRLIQSRGFNSLKFDDLLGTITKKSKNVEKFRSEIKWQIDVPKAIKVLVPRVLDYDLDKEPFITMEFYSYPTLAEIWLFSRLSDGVYFSIIDRLFKILDLFRGEKRDISENEYRDVYIIKTINRVSAINNTYISELLQNESININGKKLNNWAVIENTIFEKGGDLYNKDDNCFMHGDFCLSNILYDLRSGITRLIDPRGVWGDSESGDIKYDVAKLRHSICGDYDYIVNDLFSVVVVENSIEYKIYNSDKINVKKYFDTKAAKYFDLKMIKLIEGLLFLSMISLHDDNKKRQLVMYAKSIEIFNEVLV